MECISCIKDGNTGVCRDIKDKQARELIEGLKTALSVLQDTVAAMSGVDGGHLATDTDIQGLQSQINGINEILEVVATDTELDTIQKQIDTINGQLAALDNTYAKDTDIQGLQSQINNLDTNYAKDTDIQGLQNQINSLDNTYAKDTDIQSLQTQITNLQTLVNGLSGNVDGLATTGELNEVIQSLNEVINTINALDNTYATDSDIQDLQSQINSLDNTYAKDTDIQGLDTRITTLENAGGGAKKTVYEFNETLISATAYSSNTSTNTIWNKTSLPYKVTASKGGAFSGVIYPSVEEILTKAQSGGLVLLSINNIMYPATYVRNDGIFLATYNMFIQITPKLYSFNYYSVVSGTSTSYTLDKIIVIE